MSALPPGSTIGIIGGGQLGRMLSLAAAQLGYHVHIYAPEPECCAAEVSAKFSCGAYDDRAALAAFAESVDAATFEFENVDAAPLREVANRVPLFPPLAALETGQDRIAEKKFAANCGARTAEWVEVNDRAALDTAIARIGTPAILKTVRFGYDGKGQARLRHASDADAAWEALGNATPLILESMVAFAHEYSLLVARDQQGHIGFWDPPENVHHDGILDRSSVPAHPEILAQLPAARGIARRIAEKLDYVGVFAIEFFAGRDGPVFNEMAPRVHNSGHWTTEGALTSQFENHIRAVAGLPLGATTLVVASVEMRNLIGDDVNDWRALAADPTAHLHFYGKQDARPGRKMGHVTRILV